MANAELLGVMAAIPGGAQADGVTELPFVRDLVGRCAEAGHLDAHAARIGQGDHQRADEGMELQFARDQALELRVRAFKRGSVRHQRPVSRGQGVHLVVHPHPDDIALLAEDADLRTHAAVLVAQHLEFLQPQAPCGRGIVRLQAQVVVGFGDPLADAAAAAADTSRALLLLDRRQPGLLAAAGIDQPDRTTAFRGVETAVAACRQQQHGRQQHGSHCALHCIAPLQAHAVGHAIHPAARPSVHEKGPAMRGLPVITVGLSSPASSTRHRPAACAAHAA